MSLGYKDNLQQSVYSVGKNWLGQQINKDHNEKINKDEKIKPKLEGNDEKNMKKSKVVPIGGSRRHRRKSRKTKRRRGRGRTKRRR